MFDAVYRAKRGEGLVVLAVDYRESRDLARSYVGEQKLSLPVLLDTHGDVAQLYRVAGLPVTYFIGADGVVRGITIGVVAREDLTKKLAAIGVDVPPGALKEPG
jgi:hypothetical protein